MMKVKNLFQTIVVVIISTVMSLAIVSCDFGARGDLKRAEKALLKADKWKAEQWAEHQYRLAQAAFDEACALEHNMEINAARDKAQEAYDYANEAAELSQKRQEELEKEQGKIGSSYKE